MSQLLCQKGVPLETTFLERLFMWRSVSSKLLPKHVEYLNADYILIWQMPYQNNESDKHIVDSNANKIWFLPFVPYFVLELSQNCSGKCT